MYVFIYLIICVVAIICKAHRNNVCPTYFDYNNKISNKNCWYNSDAELTAPEIIQKYNYPFIQYDFITDDGYKLPLFRIPHGKTEIQSPDKISQPVLLLHGIFTNCVPFISFGNRSIGFNLADNGYDVWLANNRGSTYGKEHVKYSAHDYRFWNFSFHEMAVYDVPKALDLIYDVTGRNDTILIGNSMGTNIQLVYASELADHARQRVKFMVYLAPTAFLLKLKAPLANLASLWPVVEVIAEILRIGEIFSKEQFPTWLSKLICLGSESQVLFCELFIMSMCGYDLKNFPPEIFPVMVGHHPAGASFKSFIHLVQNTESKRFCKFNYGRNKNKNIYNFTKSPDYNMSNVIVPGLIMYSTNDYLSTVEGSHTLYNSLPKGNVLFEVKDKKYTHIDFFYSKTVVTEIIEVMLEFMNKYKTTITL